MTYYTSAEDWAGLGRVTDCVLNEYVVNGTLVGLQSHNVRSLTYVRIGYLCSPCCRDSTVSTNSAVQIRCSRDIHSPLHLCCPLCRIPSASTRSETTRR